MGMLARVVPLLGSESGQSRRMVSRRAGPVGAKTAPAPVGESPRIQRSGRTGSVSAAYGGRLPGSARRRHTIGPFGLR